MKISTILVLFGTISHFSEASILCGDETSANDVRIATEEIVKRLMAIRKPDWSWDRPTTMVVLQVTVPKMFFGRKHTERRLKLTIRQEFSKMNLRQKSEHILAAKSLCLNPRNIRGIKMIESVHEEVMKQFPGEKDIYPAIGYNMFSIAIGSLCSSGEKIEKWIVEKLLAGQNENGSFGNGNHIMDTIMLLPAVQCLRQVQSPEYNVTDVEEAVRKMRHFIIDNTMVQTDGKGISDKAMMSLTMIGLKKSADPEEDPSEWRCSQLSNLLGIFPELDEDEFHLVSRLMRLHGAAFMDVGIPGYRCVQPDPVPDDYVPSCLRKYPCTCEP